MDPPTAVIRRGAEAAVGAVAGLSHQARSLAGAVTGARHPFQLIGGGIYALCEAAAFPSSLTGRLGRQEHNPFDGTLKGSFTAHPL